ncbi:MAG: hypothetical protein IT380_00970 [Myxococcales bacterium]|nr:hypothetical protein [Myxococcales bacterium]
MSVAWDAVGELTRQAWGLVAGAPKPRSEWVCRRFLPGEPRPDTLEELNCSR